MSYYSGYPYNVAGQQPRPLPAKKKRPRSSDGGDTATVAALRMHDGSDDDDMLMMMMSPEENAARKAFKRLKVSPSYESDTSSSLPHSNTEHAPEFSRHHHQYDSSDTEQRQMHETATATQRWLGNEYVRQPHVETGMDSDEWERQDTPYPDYYHRPQSAPPSLLSMPTIASQYASMNTMLGQLHRQRRQQQACMNMPATIAEVQHGSPFDRAAQYDGHETDTTADDSNMVLTTPDHRRKPTRKIKQLYSNSKLG